MDINDRILPILEGFRIICSWESECVGTPRAMYTKALSFSIDSIIHDIRACVIQIVYKIIYSYLLFSWHRCSQNIPCHVE